MGYPKSKGVILSAQSYLDQMVASPTDLLFPANDGAKFQYGLHAAIHAAKQFASNRAGEQVEPYYSYSKLLEKFRIRTRDNDVICELRNRSPRMDLRIEEMVLPGLIDDMSIIGAAIQHKQSVMVFPDAKEGVTDLENISSWAHKNGYVVTVDGDRGLRLEK